MPRLWPRKKPRSSVEAQPEPVESPVSQESPPAEQASSSNVRLLWGQGFQTTPNGLAEDQVVNFVEKLIAEYRVRLQEQEDTASWDTFSKRVLAEAEEEAVRIRAKARQEAEGEAARTTAESKRQARELVDCANARAEELTEKAVQEILTTAQKKAQLTESRARQLSQLMLIRSREEAQDNVTEEVHGVYHKPPFHAGGRARCGTIH